MSAEERATESERESARDPDPVPRWLDRAVIGACCATIALSAGLVLTFDHGRDQGIYALVARTMLEGGMPYRDAFDFKPPGIFVVYAVARALFGPSMSGIRVLEVLSMLLSAAALLRLSRRATGSPRAGFVAAALASLVHAQLDFWHTAQPETFGGTLTLWALVAAANARELSLGAPGASPTWLGAPRRAAHLYGAAGVLLGVAGLMKPPLAGVGAALGALAALEAWRRAGAWRAAALPLITVGVGGALPIALTGAWFAARGALGDLHEVLFVFTPHYTKLSWQGTSVLPMAYYGFSEWLTRYSSALLVGLVALLAFRPAPRAVPLVVATSAAIAVHLAGIVMQGKFFPYHFGATFPLTALLAGIGLDRGLRWAAPRGHLAVGGFVAAFALAASAKVYVPSFGEVFLDRAHVRWRMVTGEPGLRDGLASVADVDMAQNRAVAAYLAQHVPPDRPVFVWGFEPVIYDLANRASSTRYVYDVPQRATWSRDGMRAALMRDLAARPPAAIVVEHHDVFRFVTGDDDDSATSLLGFDGLREMIDRDFEHATRIGDFDVYLRAER